MICVLFAHPYPDRSRANKRLLSALRDDGELELEVRALYDLYPDFDIDVELEQELLRRAEALVFQHPFYWYGMPALLKHYIDKVLDRGFAYGPGGDALRGKKCLWAITTGGEADAYRDGGVHGRSFELYLPMFEQTARFCGMNWQGPLVLHGAHSVSKEALDTFADEYTRHVRAIRGAP